MKRWLIGMSFVLLSALAHALPTVANVEAEVQKGHYVEAQAMMSEVVAAKPGSAKAHYVYAEILAHNEQFREAAQHAALARQIDPALSFTQPDKFREFETLLNREQQRVRGTSAQPARPAAAQPVQQIEQRAERSSGVPLWVWGTGLAVLAFVAWRQLRKGLAAPAAPAGLAGLSPGATPAGYGAAPAYGPGPSYAPYGAGAATPSRAGGLAGIGLAAAGGVAAGMLAEKFMQGNHGEAARDTGFAERGAFAGPALQPDPDAAALEERRIDFGNGNDWGDGGSSDVGGGGGGSSDDGW